MAVTSQKRLIRGLRWRPLVVSALLFFPPSLAAGQHRTRLDYGLAATSTVLIIADWSQALRIADNPHRWAEANPIFGHHPSEGRVNTLETLYVMWNASAMLLPKTPRRIWYATIAVGELVAVTRNLSLGISIAF